MHRSILSDSSVDSFRTGTDLEVELFKIDTVFSLSLSNTKKVDS
jgi:hypothetical protein